MPQILCHKESGTGSGYLSAVPPFPGHVAARYRRLMALRPDEFYEHALAAADSERRLPLSRMTGWGISPFEQEGLRVAPLRPPVLPEPARHGEDPSDCRACRSRDEGIWFNDRWRLGRVPGVGVPLVLMLYPRDHYDLGTCPMSWPPNWECFPRTSSATWRRCRTSPGPTCTASGTAGLTCMSGSSPGREGQAQLYGSWLVVWDDLLPEYPAEVADADAAAVADALVASCGGRR